MSLINEAEMRKQLEGQADRNSLIIAMLGALLTLAVALVGYTAARKKEKEKEEKQKAKEEAK